MGKISVVVLVAVIFFVAPAENKSSPVTKQRTLETTSNSNTTSAKTTIKKVSPIKTTKKTTPAKTTKPITTTVAPIEGPRVNTSKGTVIGFNEGTTTDVFLGIPYANPPLKKLRFKAPQDHQPWSKPLVTKQWGDVCPQLNLDQFFGGKVNQSEDCLTLNVFKPSKKNVSGLPVMVWIHGGGYNWGGAVQYPVKSIIPLVQQGVIVVSINYRLNVFGLFSTLTGAYPPNVGMLDQVKALHWVQKEIKQFGGDPNKVTIFGQSAGASSVALHTLSPLSRGLFSKAIEQSGSAFAFWAFDRTGETLNNGSRKVAVDAGCLTEEDWNSKNFGNLTCLQNLPTQVLLDLTKTEDKNPWRPTVDWKGGFAPDLPEKMEPAQVPTVIGSTHDEEALKYITELISKEYGPDAFDLDFLEEHIYMDAILATGMGGNVADLLNMIYYPKTNDPSTLNLEVFKAVTSMESGFNIFSGISREIELKRAKNPNIFVYSLDYLSQSFPWPEKIYKGVFHGMDLFYIFPNMYSKWTFNNVSVPWNLTKTDTDIQNWFVTQWTNFAKTGEPSNTTIWPPLDQNVTDRHYLSINTVPTMKNNFHVWSSNLWNNVVPAVANGGNPNPPTPEPAKKGYSQAYFITTWLLLGLLVIAIIGIIGLVVKRPSAGYTSFS